MLLALTLAAWGVPAWADSALPAAGGGFPVMAGFVPAAVTSSPGGAQGAQVSASGGLEAVVLADRPLRPGGADVVVVDVADGAPAPTDARDVRLVVRPGGEMGIRGVRADGWSCRTTTGSVTCTTRRVAGDVGGGRVALTLAPPIGLGVASAPLVADLSWRDAASGRRRSYQANATVPIDPPLGVTVDAVGATTIPVDRGGIDDVALLRARVAGLGEEDVALRWTQACVTTASAVADAACRGQVSPRAEFLDPVVDSEAGAQATERVRVPYTDAPARLVFRATVTDDGRQVGDTVVITTDPVEDARYAPRTGALEQALRTGAADRTAPGRGDQLPLLRGGISGTGPTRATPGRPVTLVARVAGARVVSVGWSISRGSREVMVGSRAQGARLVLRPPASSRGEVAVITATMRLAGGDLVEFSELVMVGEPAPRPSMRIMNAARTEMSRAIAPPPGGMQAHQVRAIDTVCAVAEAVRRGTLRAPPVPGGGPQAARAPGDITLQGGARVWLGPGSSVAGTGCTSATQVSFVNATVALGRMAFQNVSGRITAADGLVITRGALRPPDDWATAMPSLAPAMERAASALAVTVPRGASVGARLNADGSWGRLAGQLEIPAGIELLPLPAGWSLAPARLRIEEGGFLGLAIEARAPAGQSGSALLSGVVGPTGEAEIEAVVAGIGVLRQADGTQVTVDASGLLSLSWADDPNAPADAPLRLVVDPEVRGSVGNVRLARNFLIREAGFTWTPSSIDVTASVRAGTETNFMDLRADGRYAGAEDWGLALQAAGSWEVIGGVRIEGLAGRVSRAANVTTVSASGRATGWQPSSAFRVSTLEAALTNQCPVGVPPAQCDPAAVRVDLTADGMLALPGASEVAWRSTASVNLATRRFTLTGGLDVADGAVGPAPLNLRRVAITLSNENAARVCTPAGVAQAQGADNGVRLSLTAIGTVLARPVSFTGEFGDGSLCLLGTLDSMPASVPQASSFSGIQVAYSSRDATITAAPGVVVPLRAGEMTVAAGFRLPEAAATIGVRGEGRLVGRLGLRDGSVMADVSFALSNRPVIFGREGAANLGLDGVGFRFAYDSSFSFTANAQMSYVTPAARRDGEALASASNTPLRVDAGFENGSAVIGGGVDTTRAPSGVVDDAFGVNELAVRRFVVSASVGRENNVAFDGDVTLPGRWGRPIGIRDGSVVRLAAAISQESPCIEFAIRRSTETDRQMAVDLANAGLLQARRMGLLLAPSGCSIGVGPLRRDIAPGFGMSFDGLIGGLFEVRVESMVRLPTPQRPTAFAATADLRIGEFSLGSYLRVRETTVSLAIDTIANRYELGFSGGVEVLGNTVNMAAQFRAGGGNIEFVSNADARLSVLGFGLDGQVAFDMRATPRGIERLAASGDLGFRVLGVNLARVRAGFVYDQGLVRNFHLGVQMRVNVLIAAADGTLSINYDRSGTNLDTLQFRVELAGHLRFLFFRRAFDWSIVQWGPRRVGTGRNPEQGVDWSQTDSKEVSGPGVNKIRWSAGRVRNNDVTRFVTSLKYATAYRVSSTGSDAPAGDARGGLVLTSCVFEAGARERCAPGSRRDFVGRVDFRQRRLVLENGIEFCNPQLCANGTDAVIQGDGWRAVVRQVERAREEFARANPGLVLPPLRSWSVNRQPMALGQVLFGSPPWEAPRPGVQRDATLWERTAGVNATQRASGGRFVAFGSYLTAGRTSPPGLVVPVTGDWDGDGIDSVGIFVPQVDNPLDHGAWLLRGDAAGVSEVRRGTCAARGPVGGSPFCQPVEPPGTRQWERTPPDARQGRRGAVYPVVGDWNGRANDGVAVDDLGIVRLLDGRLGWELWPQGDPISTFTFGGATGGVVDRPVTGDWNADGVTDPGIYTPPSAPGEVGTWRLRLMPAAKAGDASADVVVRLGGYGDRPVTGDWNEDGIDDIAVVSQPNGLRDPATWRLRYTRSESCDANCAPDRTIGYGFGDVPIAGRWG